MTYNINKTISDINEMVINDQKMRNIFKKTWNWDFEIDKNNTLNLKLIIKDVWLPKLHELWKQTSDNIWLIIQHTNDHDLQKEYLELIKKLPKGQVNNKNIALLTDRVLMYEWKPQIYWTQFIQENWKWFPYKIRNIKNLENRRKKIWLSSFEEYKKHFK